MNEEDDLIKSKAQMDFLNKTSAVEDMVEYMRPTDVKDLGINISGGQFDPTIKDYYIIPGGGSGPIYDSPKDYPSKYVGKVVIDPDPDLFADSDYIENDKIQRKIIGKWKPDKVSKNIEDLHTTINQKEQPMKAYVGGSPLNPIDQTGKVENIEYKNSENSVYIKTPKEIDPSKLISIQAISAYFEEAYPIKIDPVAEFEHKSTNRRYSVS